MPVARLQDVSLQYGKTCALKAVSLEIPAQCMVGLIGPDGVGKSSLLALIAGARKIQSGQIEVLGGDMVSRAHRRQVCPHIAYMPQGLGKNLYPTLSVIENLDCLIELLDAQAALTTAKLNLIEARLDRARALAALIRATEAEHLEPADREVVGRLPRALAPGDAARLAVGWPIFWAMSE